MPTQDVNLTIDKNTVGLGNVDNTSDANKPVSTAQAAALALKESLSNKGQANGYAGLDPSGKVPTSQLPADAVLSVFARTGAILAQNGDYTASQITNTPSGGIAATTVQVAINELDTEKVGTSDSRLTDARNLKLLASSVTRYAAATTATDDVAHSLLIPAGTLTTGDFLRAYSLLSTTSSASNKIFKLWIHTANVNTGDPVPGGATQIAQNTITTSGQTSILARLFAVRNNTTIIGHGNGTTQATGEYSQATTAPTEITIPTLASDVYLLVSANRASAGDTAAVEYSRVNKED